MASSSERARLRALSELASYRLEELLGELGVDLRRAGKALTGPCPVHGGDNPNALILYPDGHSLRGNWRCFTKGCEKVFHPTLVGLTRGVLSNRQLGWNEFCGRTRLYDFMGAVRWLCRFLGRDWADVRVDAVAAEKHRFLADAAVLGRPLPQTPETGWDRAFVRERLSLPSAYYVGRGYSPATLDRFDVGESRVADPAHPMFRRAVVPVYDRHGSRAVGVTARSLWPQCPGCKRWHDATLPCPTGASLHLPSFAKWRNSDGFRRENHLYNFWSARDAIRRTGVAVLVEGPGDVWRLCEAGVENAVALFGVSLTDPQQVLLEGSGAMSVALLLDRDGAGGAACGEIERALGRSFRVHRPDYGDAKDVGEMDAGEVRERVLPLLAKIRGC